MPQRAMLGDVDAVAAGGFQKDILNRFNFKV